MARGRHPQRTPIYGGIIIVTAMVAATVVAENNDAVPAPVRVVIYAIAGLAMLIGAIMTLRDLS